MIFDRAVDRLGMGARRVRRVGKIYAPIAARFVRGETCEPLGLQRQGARAKSLACAVQGFRRYSFTQTQE